METEPIPRNFSKTVIAMEAISEGISHRGTAQTSLTDSFRFLENSHQILIEFFLLIGSFLFVFNLNRSLLALHGFGEK